MVPEKRGTLCGLVIFICVERLQLSRSIEKFWVKKKVLCVVNQTNVLLTSGPVNIKHCTSKGSSKAQPSLWSDIFLKYFDPRVDNTK